MSLLWKSLDSLIFCGLQTQDDRKKYQYSVSNSISLWMRKGMLNDRHSVAIGWAVTKISGFLTLRILSTIPCCLRSLSCGKGLAWRKCKTKPKTRYPSLGISSLVTFSSPLFLAPRGAHLTQSRSSKIVVLTLGCPLKNHLRSFQNKQKWSFHFRP